jgi:hypothetical protein
MKSLEPGVLKLLRCPHCGQPFTSAATHTAACRNEGCGKTFHPEQKHIVRQSCFPVPEFVTADKLPRGNYGKVKEP